MSDSEEWESAVPHYSDPGQTTPDAPVLPDDGEEDVFGEDSGVQIDIDAEGCVVTEASQAVGKRRRPGRTRGAAERFVVRSRVTYLSWLAWAAHCDGLADADAIVSAVTSQSQQLGFTAAAAGGQGLGIAERAAQWLAFRFPIDSDAASESLGCDSQSSLLRVLSDRRLQTPCLPAQAAVFACALLRSVGLAARIAVAFDLPFYSEEVAFGSASAQGGSSTSPAASRGRKRSRAAATDADTGADAGADVVDAASEGAHGGESAASSRGRGSSGKLCRARVWTEVLVSDNGGEAAASSVASALSASSAPRWLALEPGSSALVELSAVLTKSPSALGGGVSRSRAAPRPFPCVVTAGPGDSVLLRDATLDCYGEQPLRCEAAYALQRSHGLLGDAATTIQAPASAVLNRSCVRESRAGAAASAAVASAVRLAQLGSGAPDASSPTSSANEAWAHASGQPQRRRRVSAKSAALHIASAAENSLLVDGVAVLVGPLPALQGAPSAHRGAEGVAWIDHALTTAGTSILLRRLSRLCKSHALRAGLRSHQANPMRMVAGALDGGIIDLVDDSDSDVAAPPSNRASHLCDGPGATAGIAAAASTSAAAPSARATASSLAPVSSLPAGIPFPGKLDAYKKHALFALERFLAPDEMIFPREPVLGYHRGEPIYPRSHVHRLLTADQWLRQEARVVIPLEAVAGGEGEGPGVARPLPPPAKWGVPRRLARGRAGGAAPLPQAAASADHEDGEEEGPSGTATLALYGAWQTAPYVPPPHTLGSPLPRNAHGNLELWGGNRAFLPAGLEWIPLKTTRAAAASVGVESVEVVIGFEHRAGRPFPVLLGAVVEAASAPAVRAAADAIGQAAILKGISDRARRVLARWESLVRGVLIAKRVREQYGGGGGGGGMAAIAQTPLLAQPLARPADT